MKWRQKDRLDVLNRTRMILEEETVSHRRRRWRNPALGESRERAHGDACY